MNRFSGLSLSAVWQSGNCGTGSPPYTSKTVLSPSAVCPVREPLCAGRRECVRDLPPKLWTSCAGVHSLVAGVGVEGQTGGAGIRGAPGRWDHRHGRASGRGLAQQRVGHRWPTGTTGRAEACGRRTYRPTRSGRNTARPSAGVGATCGRFQGTMRRGASRGWINALFALVRMV